MTPTGEQRMTRAVGCFVAGAILFVIAAGVLVGAIVWGFLR